jgi:hypothetical protein
MRTGTAEGSTTLASSLVWRFTLVVWTGVVVALGAAELKPQTIEAFDRYVEVTEARMQAELAGEAPFLWVDRLPDDDREEAYAKLRAGQVVIDRLETRDGKVVTVVLNTEYDARMGSPSTSRRRADT